MPEGSIKVSVDNTTAHVTVHSGGPVTGMLCTPKEGQPRFEEFLSLSWIDRADNGDYHRQVHVYLRRGEVEYLRNMLTKELAKMGE